MTEPDPETPTLRRVEVATAILLSLAGVLSAWASYQAALWGGVQANHYAGANAKTTEASRLSVVDGQAVGSDTLLFTAWLEAAAEDDARRMIFFEHRFSPEMRKVFQPWRAKLPADLRSTPVDSDARPLFPRPEHAAGIEARRLQAAADTEFAEGDTANGIGDRFVAATVVLSTVLFLGGISPLLTNNGARVAVLALSAILGIAASVFIFSLPVAAL